jgi:hypothetical protein
LALDGDEDETARSAGATWTTRAPAKLAFSGDSAAVARLASKTPE